MIRFQSFSSEEERQLFDDLTVFFTEFNGQEITADFASGDRYGGTHEKTHSLYFDKDDVFFDFSLIFYHTSIPYAELIMWEGKGKNFNLGWCFDTEYTTPLIDAGFIDIAHGQEAIEPKYPWLPLQRTSQDLTMGCELWIYLYLKILARPKLSTLWRYASHLTGDEFYDFAALIDSRIELNSSTPRTLIDKDEPSFIQSYDEAILGAFTQAELESQMKSLDLQLQDWFPTIA
ncbi:MAG: hypothetical protein F6J87_09710 [Spirulina sp. SIO3F2]|nr:hypothetical protein [Spirulina sp. SIO3F2]